MSLYYDSDDVQLHHGDALDVARTLPDGLARTIVTSPPYFGLRDYGEDGQIGAEASVGEYVARMVGLFRELRRVLADDGTLWMNLGDSYSGDGRTGRNDAAWKGGPERMANATSRDLPAKNLIGIPWRVALALQDDGWILRSDIIWAKPNPMPESVTDRPTKSHEYLFLFAKSPRYYYDADSIREPHPDKALYQQEVARRNPHRPGKAAGAPGQSKQSGMAAGLRELNALGANKRTVWTVPTVPFPGSHFAVYPPDLIRPCIRAGSEPGDIVLDPFSGSGTTGAVATFEGRKYIGIDLNRDYLRMSLETRFLQPSLPWEAL